jgi:hypothetical protein
VKDKGKRGDGGMAGSLDVTKQSHLILSMAQSHMGKIKNANSCIRKT